MDSQKRHHHIIFGAREKELIWRWNILSRCISAQWFFYINFISFYTHLQTGQNSHHHGERKNIDSGWNNVSIRTMFILLRNITIKVIPSRRIKNRVYIPEKINSSRAAPICFWVFLSFIFSPCEFACQLYHSKAIFTIQFQIIWDKVKLFFLAYWILISGWHYSVCFVVTFKLHGPRKQGG